VIQRRSVEILKLRLKTIVFNFLVVDCISPSNLYQTTCLVSMRFYDKSDKVLFLTAFKKLRRKSSREKIPFQTEEIGSTHHER